MSSKSKKASQPKGTSPRATNEELFQKHLQEGMALYGCGIASTPMIGFAQDGTLRLLDTKYSIVPIPKKAPAVQAPATAPKKK